MAKYLNGTENLITTWKGIEIRPGEIADLDLPDNESKWLLRHGCKRPRKAPERVATPQPDPMPSAVARPSLRSRKDKD